jgi:hypothetical protein
MNTATAYNFDLTGPRFGIDTAALYGFWERKDGTEGGELRFDRLASGALDLTDFDGAYALPLAIVGALRSAGVRVSDDFI